MISIATKGLYCIPPTQVSYETPITISIVQETSVTIDVVQETQITIDVECE